MLIVFFSLLGLTAVTRVIELGISRKHRRALFAAGAAPVPDPGFAGMAALHTAVLLGAIVEVWVFRRSAPIGLGCASAVGVVLANGLRIWAIASLGEHWNVRVVDSLALGVVASGPYRWVRHPNYVAVFLELLLLPLVQGAWLTAGLGSLVHVRVLARRIAVEESILLANPRYREHMAHKPRFFPGRSSRGASSAELERS